jgi:hypothetical protein
VCSSIVGKVGSVHAIIEKMKGKKKFDTATDTMKYRETTYNVDPVLEDSNNCSTWACIPLSCVVFNGVKLMDALSLGDDEALSWSTTSDLTSSSPPPRLKNHNELTRMQHTNKLASFWFIHSDIIQNK